MAEEVTPAEQSDATSDGAEESRGRRAFRLAGVVALGGFVVVHLGVQASALGGGATYDAIAARLSRSPVVAVLELVLVAVPLLFHAAYGLHLTRAPSRQQVDIDRFGGRRAWLAQRMSAVAIAVFACVHLWDFRLQRVLFGLSDEALYTALTARLSSTAAGVPWIALLYLVGVFAVAFHLANGLFAATGAWRIGASPSGRRRARLVTAGLGALIFLVGAASVIGIATGTRLLPSAALDSATPDQACGSDVPAARPASAPSR